MHWPEPLFQPDRHTGCMQHSVAYACRALGFPAVTPADIYAYRAQQQRIETAYPKDVLGVQMEGFWQDYARDPDHKLHKRYWMGPHNRAWVEEHLALGHIAVVHVHRIETMSHVVVLLPERDAFSALIMDPLFGFIWERWEWFLGPGAPGKTCHQIGAWYWNEAPREG